MDIKNVLRECCEILKSHSEYTGGNETTIDKLDEKIISVLNELNSQRNSGDLIGREISVDVSTGEEDAFNRVFAKIIAIDGGNIIAEEIHRNFTEATPSIDSMDIPQEVLDYIKALHPLIGIEAYTPDMPELPKCLKGLV
jgi:hypothetical protein